MNRIKSLSWVVGLSMVAGILTAVPARADRSYSDITGTNIWNNTAPIFETDGTLDSALIERVQQLNQESERVYQACNTAIAQLEQNSPTIRRYSRQPGNETAAVPVACRQLEELRAEAQTLKLTLDEAVRSRSNPAFLPW
ncbi:MULTISPECIES: hypothetical protein [unclassified Coleofasciculus]|uniref:hypothetical protein n=1 Tax=unclassified Coleofasciculus TaxID=2692782 RepID=UPI00187E9B92|nr:MULTISPECIES: hypothetical protein [unclassified Coleofasciculus]MBE9127757.1 hypothetical protein [Coleofasciculus sp. LEGE 07081]MBE9149457.1 hypothetical protein [Coleofasciculus sp. LEGE 07092]